MSCPASDWRWRSCSRPVRRPSRWYSTRWTPGVGGKVAVEVGRRLARLAQHSQVVVVTHLAQVAAFADRHYVVVKSDDGQVTTSGVVQVADEDRAVELARMMAGLDTTESALAHAGELVELAASARERRIRISASTTVTAEGRRPA